MTSITDALNEILEHYPFIEEGLSFGIINYSAFARTVQPQVEKRVMKKVQTNAITMALTRISKKLQRTKVTNLKTLPLSDITVRSNLEEFTFLNSDSLLDTQRQLFNQFENQQDIVCSLSHGVRETTFIVSTAIAGTVEKLFKNESLQAHINNLSAMTIKLPKETVYSPGAYYQILKLLAWRGINIIEVVSTYTELTIVFENRDIDRAFSVLKSYKA